MCFQGGHFPGKAEAEAAGSVWMLLLHPLLLRHQLIYAALDQTLITGDSAGTASMGIILFPCSMFI